MLSKTIVNDTIVLELKTVYDIFRKNYANVINYQHFLHFLYNV